MWAEPSLLSVLWFLGWREFTAKITSEHQSSPVRLLFYSTCFLFIVIIYSFLHLKHDIQYKSLVKKNFIWNANLIKCRKININHGGKNERALYRFRGIIFLYLKWIQFYRHLNAFVLLDKSIWVLLNKVKGGGAYYRRK